MNPRRRRRLCRRGNAEVRSQNAEVALDLMSMRFKLLHSYFCILLRLSMSISENIAAVRERIEAGARRVGRNPDDIVLMAVSKTQPPERIREAYEAGQRLFGENRVQEFAGKFEALRDLQGAGWHMIGHLNN